jgi:hypothetical protein
MVGVIAGQLILQTVDGRQCHLRAVKLGDRDGPVEGDDRGGVEADELVVEGDDLRPVGLAYIGGGGVHGVDRGEDLVATRSRPGGQPLAHQPVALGDQRRVPGPTVLLVEGTSSPLAETRAVRRASVRSISASSPATSPSSGNRARIRRVSRIASAVRS